MEITNPNQIKLRANETIYELIQPITPGHEKDHVNFLEGPLWRTARTYNNKLATHSYKLINEHLYVVRTIDESGTKIKKQYLKVSSRGNINEISYDEALSIVRKRKGYVSDDELLDIGPNTDPAIPDCDTATCDW
jgi:hypothetical protein